MVQFPQFRFRTLCVQVRMTGSHPPGYPIRPSVDLRMCAPPHGFSQLTTAFFASTRQGIHRKPFSRLTILSSARARANARTRTRPALAELPSPFPIRDTPPGLPRFQRSPPSLARPRSYRSPLARKTEIANSHGQRFSFKAVSVPGHRHS